MTEEEIKLLSPEEVRLKVSSDDSEYRAFFAGYLWNVKNKDLAESLIMKTVIRKDFLIYKLYNK